MVYVFSSASFAGTSKKDVIKHAKEEVGVLKSYQNVVVSYTKRYLYIENLDNGILKLPINTTFEVGWYNGRWGVKFYGTHRNGAIAEGVISENIAWWLESESSKGKVYTNF